MNHSSFLPLAHTTPIKGYDFNPEWQGQRSQRFPRPKKTQPHRDLIKSNFDIPDQTPVRGRSHFAQQQSFQKTFRPTLHQVPEIKHWHLRQSRIRTMQFKPTQPHPRPERLHNNSIFHNPQERKPQSIRTFYVSNSRTEREYRVEDRMQRKVRIDPAQMRRTFFQGLDIFGKK